MIRSTTSQDVDAPFRAMLESAPLPAHEDLVGAAKAMLRLQRTYDPYVQLCLCCPNLKHDTQEIVSPLLLFPHP